MLITDVSIWLCMGAVRGHHLACSHQQLHWNRKPILEVLSHMLVSIVGVPIFCVPWWCQAFGALSV